MYLYLEMEVVWTPSYNSESVKMSLIQNTIISDVLIVVKITAVTLFPVD